jgi:hypothetical protein
MNKLEEIFDNKLGKGSKVYGELCLPRHYVVEKSAEITTDVAVKFLSWCNEPMYRAGGELGFRERALAQFPDYKEYILINEKGENVFGTGKFLTEKELFEEFINNHYGK